MCIGSAYRPGTLVIVLHTSRCLFAFLTVYCTPYEQYATTKYKQKLELKRLWHQQAWKPPGIRRSPVSRAIPRDFFSDVTLQF